MGRKIECVMLVALLTLLNIWFACVGASSLEKKEHLRRNLLANGLAQTPPMGYINIFLLLIFLQIFTCFNLRFL
jgi:hypothetical protein